MNTPMVALGAAFLGAGIGGFLILCLLALCWWRDSNELKKLKAAKRPILVSHDGESEWECDHDRMTTVNADGWCLICGEEV